MGLREEWVSKVGKKWEHWRKGMQGMERPEF